MVQICIVDGVQERRACWQRFAMTITQSGNVMVLVNIRETNADNQQAEQIIENDLKQWIQMTPVAQSRLLLVHSGNWPWAKVVNFCEEYLSYAIYYSGGGYRAELPNHERVLRIMSRVARGSFMTERQLADLRNHLRQLTWI